MEVLNHHIYEYKKGIRSLVLHTMKSDSRELAEQRLKRNEIDYIVREVNSFKFNIFFGDNECIKVINHFGQKNLNEFTAEEDFILGIMLGYDKIKQCSRYISLKKKAV